MKKTHSLLVCIILSLLCINLSATNYYVTTAGVNVNDGLSWANPTTLDAALAHVQNDDDAIHVAAGTYIPTVTITGVISPVDGDRTFEIKKNISIIGGYPTVPVENDLPTSTNITILSGATLCYHVVAVTAPVVTDKKVMLKNISITGGNAFSSTSGSPTINGIANFYRSYGGGVIIGGAVVEFNSCKVYGNQSRAAVPGVYVFAGAKVRFYECSINDNTGSGNGGGIWNEASTVYLYNSNVSSNQVTGICGGVYAILTSANTTSVTGPKTYMYNSTINNNTASHKTAYYGREKSEGLMINCTVSGNLTSSTSAASTGAGICLYTGAAGVAANAVKLDIINSTITNNSSTAAGDFGGGIRVNDQYCTLNIYNSIISGNTVGAIGAKVIGDIAVLNNGAFSKKNTVVSDRIFDASGVEVLGKTFDFATMLGALADNGGATKTCKLLLTEELNPSNTLGMSSAELTTLGGTFVPVVPENIIAFDQLGNPRTGRVIGAWTANRLSTSVFENYGVQKPIVYTEGNSICVQTKVDDVISVYAVTGQRIQKSCAIGSITKINNITKGNIYIVSLNGRSTKILF